MPHAQSLSGLIERVAFFTEDSGFCVLKVKAKGHRDLVTVVGSLASVSAGEWVTAEGRWRVATTPRLKSNRAKSPAKPRRSTRPPGKCNSNLPPVGEVGLALDLGHLCDPRRLPAFALGFFRLRGRGLGCLILGGFGVVLQIVLRWLLSPVAPNRSLGAVKGRESIGTVRPAGP